MEIKLFDSELKVMEVLWEQGATSAKDLASILGERAGWSKTTVYTVIKKCIEKGAAIRKDPGFMCTAVVTRDMAREYETNELIDKMYGGKADQLVASILGGRKLSRDQIEKLKSMVDRLE